MGSHAGSTMGSWLNTDKTSSGTNFLSTTISKTNSRNHSDVMIRYPFSPLSSPQLFSTRHFSAVCDSWSASLNTFSTEAKKKGMRKKRSTERKKDKEKRQIVIKENYHRKIIKKRGKLPLVLYYHNFVKKSMNQCMKLISIHQKGTHQKAIKLS